MVNHLIDIVYLISSVLVIIGIKRLNSPDTARSGNLFSTLAIFLAVVVTLLNKEIVQFHTILIGAAIGGTIGVIFARMVKMTEMPEMIAMLNGFGSISSALIGITEFYRTFPNSDGFSVTAIILSAIVGASTFSGSIIAFAKLREVMTGKAILYRFQHPLNLLMFLAIVGFSIYLPFQPDSNSSFIMINVLALVLGITLVLPIGGADMPVVIALHNSYSGVAVLVTGFLFNNNVLIIIGSLVGSSGMILTYVMCKGMNRSVINVMFGAVATENKSASSNGKPARRSVVKEYSIEDAITVLQNCRSLIVVPGYGLAAAQAQHAVRELVDLLEERGVSVKYAIHPVAGRMPGHMNVLLAEANVPYPQLYDMDDINDEFAKTDVALVIGANDVVNPAAKNTPESPIYGMPILDVESTKAVIVLKRSMNPGFAGIENELFERPNTMMVFGDARKTVNEFIKGIKE
ncbi:MAG: NAD(P)(+) transhydrogenase (Re/Si-specific) subunit beta [Nitrospirae bacterium]|nr:NAD(P)(+) transhydrogenase (Re/Si-specific) subunit beta [Nitrospirota bacterium]MBI3352668.1 NAD(P)(+) transhydrogenase (Re/Si-specific) subunit beta [Nitrospirota bacterium]